MKSKKSKLTRTEALKIGRLSRAERAKARRKIQNRRAQQRVRDRRKAALLAARRPKAPGWYPPPPPDPPALAPTPAPDPWPEVEAEPRSNAPKRRRRKGPYVRQAVAAKPEPGRVHGQNRGGESARSWGERGSATRVPVDVDEWLREEF